MLIDNKRRIESAPLSVYEFIFKYLQQEGVFEIVTCYFSIADLARLYEYINHFISNYHLILGEIARTEKDRDKILNPLNESPGLDSGFHLNYISKQAINFIEQDKVNTKTLKPNFCHAKVYLFRDRYDDPQRNFYVLGSSNSSF